MSTLTDLQMEETYDPLISPQVFCMKSGLPAEEQFTNQPASIKLKQVNVMGHNKDSRK